METSFTNAIKSNQNFPGISKDDLHLNPERPLLKYDQNKELKCDSYSSNNSRSIWVKLKSQMRKILMVIFLILFLISIIVIIVIFMKQSDQCTPADTSSCARDAECAYSSYESAYVCKCVQGYIGDGRTCYPQPPPQAPQAPQQPPIGSSAQPAQPTQPAQATTCDQDLRICHVDANCIYNRQESRYSCVCKAGYSGDGYSNCLREAENITISCHINWDANRTHPNLGISHGIQGDLIECSNYLRRCHVNNSNLEKSRSQIECVTNLGITANCTHTDFWLRDTHCGPEFNDSSCEMMTISCPKEELVMTTAKGEDLILLLSTEEAIYQYDLSANRKLELIDNYALAMDYWLKGSTIIWSDWVRGKIYMCNLTKNLQFPKMIACDDNGNHAVLVEHKLYISAGLAVDWIHGLLFWTDYWRDTINVMDLNTKQHKVLFKDVDKPLAIAVDPSKGLIFWIEFRWADQRNTFERASMDGNDRMTIANNSSTLGIALDIFNERVYWADYYTKTIASVDYNGNDWRTILHSDTLIKEPHSLAIFEDKLYWSDLDQHGVFVMNKFNGTEVRKLISVDKPRTVRVYHSAVQPELPNKCDQHSCGDGAICLPKGNSFDNEGKPQPHIGLPYSCVCADGYTTGKKPNTCILSI